MYIPEWADDANDDMRGVLHKMLYTACTDAEEYNNSLKCKRSCDRDCVFFSRTNLLTHLLKELSEENEDA